MSIIGVDIGGTKCRVVSADPQGHITSDREFATVAVNQTLNELYRAIESLTHGPDSLIGISCGGPLDEPSGLILSPPNLPGWDRIPIVEHLTRRFGGKAYLMNDANAGALAEWRFGAATGSRNVVFLTYGTGMGAGLILDGRLYEGTNGMAGEVGHIRLEQNGPVGYGKAGSFEGFCSGGGIARLAQDRAQELHGQVAFNPGNLIEITARHVADAARSGDESARRIFELSARYAGRALAVIVDILNPEVIVLGSLFVRCRDLLEKPLLETLRQEALVPSLACCRIVPALLGERIGDYAAIAVALYKSGRWAETPVP
jgi:glucokinase